MASRGYKRMLATDVIHEIGAGFGTRFEMESAS